jgi:RNA polymerase sigma-70 factor (ECF subfamily)
MRSRKRQGSKHSCTLRQRLTVIHLFAVPTAGLAVRKCLKKLNEKYKKFVILIYLYGLSYEELAAHLNARLGSVKTWVHRAIQGLAVCVEK